MVNNNKKFVFVCLLVCVFVVDDVVGLCVCVWGGVGVGVGVYMCMYFWIPILLPPLVTDNNIQLTKSSLKF